MAQTTSRPLALYALAALCLALCLAPSAHAACPVNCTQALSYTTITSPPGFAVSSGNSLSSCRRTCRYNDAPYYSFSSAGASWSCTCFPTCTTTGRVPTGSGPVQLGYGPVCPDINCPVECATELGGTFFTSPAPVRTKTGITSAKSCATFCNGKGLFYAWEISNTCMCYKTCNSTNTLTVTPEQLGYIPSCPGLPIVVPSRCSALLSACPAKKCPGMSTCKSKSVGGTTKYQCCCDPPNAPTVVKGVLKNCAPPPQ